MSEFLSRDEIIELTGKKRPSDQIAWLAKTGWIYETNAAGRPVIGRDYARTKLGGGRTINQPVGGLPNFSALA